MKCPNCGVEVNGTGGVTYCTMCGYALSGSDGRPARAGGSGRAPTSDHVSLVLDSTDAPLAGVRIMIGEEYQEGLSGKTYKFWLPKGRHHASVSFGDSYKPFEDDLDVFRDMTYKVSVKGESRPSLKILPRVCLDPVDDVGTPDPSVSVNLRVELSDPPRSGHIPASVSVCGQYKEAYTGDTVKVEVPAGTHVLHVEYEGCEPFEDSVRIDCDTVLVAKVADLRSVLMRTRPRVEVRRSAE